jgi:hypothetical protein
MKKISHKPLKDPHEYILPYKITFGEPVEIQLNNVRSYFPANKEVELNKNEFSMIQDSIYAKYIK